MLEAKDQAIKVYEDMETKMAWFAEKEREYKDRLNRMGIKLETKAAFELNLLDDNKGLKICGKKLTSLLPLRRKWLMRNEHDMKRPFRR